MNISGRQLHKPHFRRSTGSELSSKFDFILINVIFSGPCSWRLPCWTARMREMSCWDGHDFNPIISLFGSSPVSPRFSDFNLINRY